MKKSHYNKHLKDFARDLRKEATPAEKKLWFALQNKKMAGYKFLRQYAISNFIVDFACRKEKLIIEIDGYSHKFKFEQDTERDAKLAELGFRVLRFTEKEVMQSTTQVLQIIYDVLEGNLEE